MKRYNQLAMLINEFKPKTICEIGTHRGERAQLMSINALKHANNQHVSYTGYDVFETKDQLFHDQALNGKGVARQFEAEQLLEKIAENHSNFSYKLVVGDTTDTLQPSVFDIVFIDGDHRIEVIEQDYQNVYHSKVVVFDDFYREDSNGNIPDISKFGCNKIIEQIDSQSHQVIVLPEYDHVTRSGSVPGGRVYLVAVIKKESSNENV